MEDAPRRLAALTAALSKRRSTLETLLAGAAGPPAGERLHAVRVALRRTVSLARLTRDVPTKDSGEALRRAARDLRRALGTRRMHEVAVAILRARFRRDARRRAAAERLAARL
ncbi:MAG: CHAD domain-containing protein, partial [Thermoanaerobaculia bacterium]